MWWGEYRPYVPVAQRRAQAAREVEERRKKGHTVSPVVIEGRNVANTFWGKAWCENLESYSDFSNRLPRGRTYVRNGSVVDLQITPGKITALVSGSELYHVDVSISPLPTKEWTSIKSRCSGQVTSVVELLKGHLPKAAIEVVTAHDGGLFPKPKEIRMHCTCPDGARMCKHVAAAMYGVGARLDHRPELLFVLRNVDHLELVEQAAANVGKTTATTKKTLDTKDVADVFGIEFASPEAVVPVLPAEQPKRRGKSKTNTAATSPSRASKPKRAAMPRNPK